MASPQRPLSPHMQIYRLPLAVILSISHRLTGMALALGFTLFVIMLATAAAGPQAYEAVHGVVASWFGQFLLILFTYALFFHFCNGIRHLVWDAGYGFEYSTVNQSAYAVLIAAGVLTVLAWIVFIAVRGAA